METPISTLDDYKRVLGEAEISELRTLSYVRARFHYAKMFTNPSTDTLALARASYEEAIGLDATYAPAYSRLAMCCFALSQFGLGPAGELMSEARKAALQAAELDSTDSEANAIAGPVAAVFDHDWTEALRRCDLALACDRVSLAARQLCAQFVLVPLRRYEDAITTSEPLLRLDPLSPLPRKTLADVLALRGQHSQAIEQLRRVLALDECFWLAYFALGEIYASMGMTQEAIHAHERGVQIARYPQMLRALAGNYSRAGEGEWAQHTFARIASLELPNARAKGWMVFHLAGGDLETAGDCLEELIEGRDPAAVFVNCQPSHVREQPRIQRLLRRMGFAEAAPAILIKSQAAS